ncbi:unnamed protein product [Moneuplotes crassus]|uniref:Peroxin-3 n=2 Tax=Euplotes crassus TaxID=5936 RepID=A0AAD1U5T0_EUPCR|nr:unnamed protein product [Moneuplotes crassus]
MLSKINPFPRIISTIKTHKWKSAIALGAVSYGSYQAYRLYSKFKEGLGEFKKIIELMDKKKEDLPEGEQPEDGSPEELDFMQNLMKNLNEQADPILATVTENIIRTEEAQRNLILDQLKEELGVTELQRLSKEGKDNKEKIESWNKLKVEVIREFFYYIYTSQVFLSCSYIAFSILGKQLFEINSGFKGEDNLQDIIEKLGGEEETKEKTEEEKKEEKSAKKKAEYDEKVTTAVHNHFMHLLFDVLTNFVEYLKHEVIDPVIDVAMATTTLKSKMTVTKFTEEILGKIYAEINDNLFDPTPVIETKDCEDTDFDSDSDDFPKKKLNAEALNMLKEESVKKYTSLIVTKLVDYFNEANLDKYTEGIEKDLESLEELKKDLPKNEFMPSEEETASELLEKKVMQLMKDYLESRYSQSILIDSIECTYEHLVEGMKKELSEIANGNSELFYLKLIPAIYRNRDLYKETNPIIQSLKEGPKEEVKEAPNEESEPKVVEITDEEEAQETASDPKPTEEPVFANEIPQKDIISMVEEEESDIDFEEKVQRIVESIKLFTKLILTEGIESSNQMPDIGDLFGAGALSENSSEMGILSTLLSGA